MSRAEREWILAQHHVACYFHDGKVMAMDSWVDTNTGRSHSEWVDVTKWSRRKLMAWLGY